MKQTLGIAKKGRTVWQQASVLKLHRGYILTKKEILNPKKIWRTHLAPWGTFLGLNKQKNV
jgi:hypothetical protein